MTNKFNKLWEDKMNECISAASTYAELGDICNAVGCTVDAMHFATECCMASDDADEFQRFNQIRLELREKMMQMAANLTHFPEAKNEVITHLK